MNKRIKELAELAAHDTRAIHNNAYWWMQEELAEDSTWRERFAELIVKECFEVVNNNFLETIPNFAGLDNATFASGWNACTIKNIKAIKEHFGVEE